MLLNIAQLYWLPLSQSYLYLLHVRSENLHVNIIFSCLNTTMGASAQIRKYFMASHFSPALLLASY